MHRFDVDKEILPRHAHLTAFAKALPSRAVTNHDLSKLMDTSDEWVVQRTGIKTRYWVDEPTTTSDLGTDAARRTLEQLIDPTIDAIIAATLSPDHCFPGIGVQIQHKLGLPQIPAYDIRNQCSGFLYGLEMGTALVSSGAYRRILLVGAEVHSTGMDISTRGRDLAVLFGDGAASCVIEGNSESARDKSLRFEVLGTELHSDGKYMKELWGEHPGSTRFPTRLTEQMVRDGEIFPKMNGKTVFTHAVKSMVDVSRSLLTRLQLEPKDISLFVPHQANLRINQMVGSQLGFAENVVFSTIEHYGNTTAATIPIGMTDAINQNRIKPGDYILNTAFGSGFTWGAAVLRAI